MYGCLDLDISDTKSTFIYFIESYVYTSLTFFEMNKTKESIKFKKGFDTPNLSLPRLKGVKRKIPLPSRALFFEKINPLHLENLSISRDI